MNIQQIETLIKLVYSNKQKNKRVLLEALGFIGCGFTVCDTYSDIEFSHSGYIVSIGLMGNKQNKCEIWQNGVMLHCFDLTV
jgi:hypothetical protein